MNEVKVLKGGVTIPSKFIKDVEKLADGLRARLDLELKLQGLPPFQSDITYRASAAWKDHPFHYCYIGDSSTASIDFSGCDFRLDRYVLSRLYHNQLVAIAQTVWELGGQLTFNEDGKHIIFFFGCHF